jgi:hypothetical protein
MYHCGNLRGEQDDKGMTLLHFEGVGSLPDAMQLVTDVLAAFVR